MDVDGELDALLILKGDDFFFFFFREIYRY